MEEPPDFGTPLGRWPWINVHFRCHWCPRNAEVHIAVLAASYGHRAPLEWVFRRFVSGCPWDPHSEHWKPQKYGMRCGAYCPDVRSSRPPDLPPSMSGLKVVTGGKDDQLTKAPAKERRRRVGGD